MPLPVRPARRAVRAPGRDARQREPTEPPSRSCGIAGSSAPCRAAVVKFVTLPTAA